MIIVPDILKYVTCPETAPCYSSFEVCLCPVALLACTEAGVDSGVMIQSSAPLPAVTCRVISDDGRADFDLLNR